ncbi:MAG: hypothetical protein FJW39_10025 [Acidobacteria bacterium]|nr:hypothetical protein [Acidobacteriota bacterium]
MRTGRSRFTPDRTNEPRSRSATTSAGSPRFLNTARILATGSSPWLFCPRQRLSPSAYTTAQVYLAKRSFFHSKLEVADIIRTARRLYRPEPTPSRVAASKDAAAIRNCRTQTLGGHLDRCSACGHEAISYNSRRNRHCPKCQTNAREQWLAKRSEDLLPVPYFHVVFTLPHDLSALALQNNRRAVNDQHPIAARI